MADDKTVKIALILSAQDKMSRVVTESVTRSINAVGKFNKSLTKFTQANKSSMSIGQTAGIAASIGAVKELFDMTEKAEEAQTDLKLSFMKAGGAIDPLYNKFQKMGEALSISFKGGKYEMYGMLNALINTGLDAKNITNGFATSVAQYATVMKMTYPEAATELGKIAKMSNLAKKDMALLPDLMSRMKKMGISDASEIATAVGKSGMGVMGLGGIENMQKMAAIITNIKQATGGATEAGSVMQRIMIKTADPTAMMKLNAEMSKIGVSMQFFDKGGKFLGFQNMVAQLGQVPADLRQKIFGKLFGVRGAVGAAAIAQMGVNGYNATLQKMMEQETLARKAREYQLHEGYKLAKIWSSVKDSIIKLGLEVMPVFGKILDIVKKLVWGFQEWYDKSKFLGGVLKWVIIITTGLKVAIALTNLVIGGMLRNVLLLTGGFVKFAGFLKLQVIPRIWYYSLTIGAAIKSGAKWIAQLTIGMWNALKRAAISVAAYAATMWTTYAPAIWGAVAATWAFTAALFANPIVWIIAGVVALAASVYLIIKNWSKIKTFFVGIWEWIKGVFVKFWNFLKGWGKLILIPFAPFLFLPVLVIQNWKKITNFFSGLFSGIKNIFDKVVKFITGFLNKVWQLHVQAFNKIVKFIFGIGKVFYNAGKNIMNMIWQGMKSIAMKPVELIMKVVKGIRKYLPFSPAQEGPLKDIHRVKIIETIAQTMKPGPMLKAMRSVMNMTVGVKPSNNINGSSSGSGNGKNLIYNITLNISGDALNAKDEIMKALKSHESEVRRWLNNGNKREANVAY